MSNSDALRERDNSKPAEQQGLFRKFEVRRVDGSDAPGWKHHGCEYFVLDIVHDAHAKAALTAYANSIECTHPLLAADMRERYRLAASKPKPLTRQQIDHMREAQGWLISGVLRDAYRCGVKDAEAAYGITK